MSQHSEQVLEFFLKAEAARTKARIRRHRRAPKVCRTLQQLGRSLFEGLDPSPAWSNGYRRLFHG